MVSPTAFIWAATSASVLPGSLSKGHQDFRYRCKQRTGPSLSIVAGTCGFKNPIKRVHYPPGDDLHFPGGLAARFPVNRKERYHAPEGFVLGAIVDQAIAVQERHLRNGAFLVGEGPNVAILDGDQKSRQWPSLPRTGTAIPAVKRINGCFSIATGVRRHDDA